jgi:hypothetical protein
MNVNGIHQTRPPSNPINNPELMKTRFYLVSLAVILLLAFPSCYVVNFEKEIDFDLTFDINGNRSGISVSHLVDINEYSSDFEDYREYIEDIEIKVVTCCLSKFNGTSEQVITGGILTVSDQYGDGSTVLAILPDINLEQLYLHETELILEEPGVRRVEELIMTDPNICLGLFTAEVNELPSDFIITFHITAVIRGSLL